MLRRAFTIALFAAALTGCAAGFQKLDPSTVNWGERPTPAQVESAVKRHFEFALKDAESARYQISTPYRGYANEGALAGGGIRWAGYLVDVQVNAKNSFGGYTGYKPYQVLLTRDMNVYRAVEGSSHVLIHRLE